MFLNSADLMVQKARIDDLLRNAEKERLLKRVRLPRSRYYKSSEGNGRSRSRGLAELVSGLRLGGRQGVLDQPCGLNGCSTCAG